MATFTGLAAGRHRVLAAGAAGTSRSDGLIGAPEIAVVARRRGPRDDLRLAPDGRARGAAASSGSRPTSRAGCGRIGCARCSPGSRERPVIVGAQSGNVNTGAFDPLPEIVAAVRELPNAWLHVDGAFGLWAAASPALRHLVAGPRRRGLVDDRRPQVAQRPVRLRDRRRGRRRGPPRRDELRRGLLRRAGGAAVRDPTTGSPSRRAGRAASPSTPRCGSWAATGWPTCRPLLRAGPADGRRPARRAGRDDPQRRRAQPGPRPVRAAATAARTPRPTTPSPGGVIAAVQADGTCWLGGTTWHGMAAMRISVSNWSTTEADADVSVAAIRRCAAAVAADWSPAASPAAV